MPRSPANCRAGELRLGASLLATEQTWPVIDRQHWPSWAFWILIVVMLGISVLNTTLRMTHGQAAASAAQLADENAST